MRVIGTAMLLGLCFAGSARASVLSDLYTEAAGVTARCSGRDFSQADARALASRIAEDTGEHLSAGDVLRRIEQAKTAPADCAAPTAKIHMFFVQSILLGHGTGTGGAKGGATVAERAPGQGASAATQGGR